MPTRRSSSTPDDLWDRIWYDKQGKVVIFQWPNIPLLAWVVLTLISVFTNGTTATVFWYLGMAALVIWSLLEILKGANYFRRVLGVVVLLLIIAEIFKVGY